MVSGSSGLQPWRRSPPAWIPVLSRWEAAPLVETHAKFKRRRRHRPRTVASRPAPKSRHRTETRLLDQFDLFEVEFDRSRAAEDRDADLDLVLVEVELLDHAVEAGERAVQHFDLVADLVIDVDLLLGRRLGFLDAAEVAGCFALADRLRLAARAQEAGHLRRVLDEVIDVVGQVELGEDVPRHELALDLDLLTAFDFGNGLGRHFHRLDAVRQPEALGLRDDRIAHLVLEAGI